MKIGVFGGTFNPPHRGHNLLLKEISKQEHFDKIIIIPSNMPPHKNVEHNDPARRMEMARLAFPEYEVSDIELRRGGKSYTCDTLAELKKQYPDDTLCLICGSDMFKTLPRWRSPERIIRLAQVVTAARDKRDQWRLRLAKLWYSLRYGAVCRIVKLDPIVISSSEIRLSGLEGEDISQWVLPDVYEYIVKNGLYR